MSPTRAVVEHDAGDLVGLTAALVAVPSVHPAEGDLAGALEARLRARAPALAVERVGNTVVARTALGRGRRVVLGGHLDTVPAADNSEPTIDADGVAGLGAADMKGSVAVLLGLAERAHHAAHDVTFLLYDGEEVDESRNGLRRLFAEHADLVACDLAVLLEPTGVWVEAGCQGTLHVRATVRGARAHTARPWTGRNAVHAAVPILDRLVAYEAETVDVDGLAYREALQVVEVTAGIRPNVVPDECRIVVNRRFSPARTSQEAVAETVALLDGADEVEVLNESPAAAPNLGDPLVADFVESLGRTVGARVRPKLGWTDVARFAAHGIPALNFGAGDPELAHTPGERVERAELEAVRDGLAAFLGIRGDAAR
jgi:succinyl-diaminopimelate desuccinylase